MHKRRPTPPGEMLLEEFLKPLNVSQFEFSAHIGWTPARLNEIIKGKRSLTYEKALDLQDATGMPAYFWMNLQSKVDLWDAAQKHTPKKRHPAFG